MELKLYHGIFHGGKETNLTKVDKMGRTVIPSNIRKILNIKEGDYIEWTIENNKAIVRKKVSIDKNLIKKDLKNLEKGP